MPPKAELNVMRIFHVIKYSNREEKTVYFCDFSKWKSTSTSLCLQMRDASKLYKAWKDIWKQKTLPLLLLFFQLEKQRITFKKAKMENACLSSSLVYPPIHLPQPRKIVGLSAQDWGREEEEETMLGMCKKTWVIPTCQLLAQLLLLFPNICCLHVCHP